MPHPRLSFTTVMPLAVVAALALSGCSSSAGTDTTPASPVGSQSSLVAGPSVSFNGVTVSGAAGSKPVVLMSDSVATGDGLQIKDVALGDGPVLKAGEKVTVHYVARSTRTKRQFDSSWDRGTPYSYDPTKVVFKTFTDGIAGMRVGGRRIVLVPGPLAFGANPPASFGLRPNESLVYVIDLVSSP